MSNLFIEQRDRIIELEGMLSKSIDRNKALEEALKRVSHYVERLEARVDYLESLPRDPFLPENSVITSK